MKNKKILILHSSNDLYGASKIFLQIIELLKSNGHQIHVVLTSNGPLDKMISQIKGTHVSYYSLGVLRKKYLNPLGLINRLVANIKAIKFLSNYIKDHSIDLVYTNTSTILCGGIAAKKNGVPNIYHIHEIPTGNKLYEFFSGKIINRKIFPEIPPRVEYSLTKKGEINPPSFFLYLQIILLKFAVCLKYFNPLFNDFI